MKISPENFLFISPILIFLAADFIWFLILAQAVGFFAGFVILAIFSFLIFWKGLLISRRNGELFGLKSKKQIFSASLSAGLVLSEIIWVISFLPFPFFILGGLFAIIFALIFNIFKKYFKQQEEPFGNLIILAVVLIIILISISPWLPSKTF